MIFIEMIGIFVIPTLGGALVIAVTFAIIDNVEGFLFDGDSLLPPRYKNKYGTVL